MTDSVLSENISERSLTKITIHFCDKWKSSHLLTQPVVCMHIIDSHQGFYTKKQDKDKAAVSFYETQRGDVDYIMPIMTQPCVAGSEKFHILKWEESFLLNESLEYLSKKELSTMLFFEIMDVASKSVTKDNYEQLKESGMQKVAWSFLKLLGSNSVINEGKKLRLQLYKALPSQKKKKKALEIEVFQWWKKEFKTPLQASLYVSVETCEAFSIEPALRSKLPFQEEASLCVSKALNEDINESRASIQDLNNCTTILKQNTSFCWSRKKGDVCKTPTVNLLSLTTVNSCQLLKFSSGGRLLAIGSGASNQYSITIYEIPSGKFLTKKLVHSDVIYDFDWSEDDDNFLSASGDYSAKLWCSRSWTLKASFVHPSFVYAAKFEPSAKNIICTACFDHVIRIWTYYKNVQILQELEGHSDSVNTLCWIKNKTKLISADNSGHIIVWEISNSSKYSFKQDGAYERYISERELDILEIRSSSVEKIICNPSDNELIIFCGDGIVRSVDYKKGKILFKYETSTNFQKRVTGCCSPCGSLLFLSNDDGSISVWSLKTQKIQATIPNSLHPFHLSCIDYHPFEHMIGVSSSEENVPVKIYTYDNKDSPEKSLESKVPNENFETFSSLKISKSSQMESRSMLDHFDTVEVSYPQQRKTSSSRKIDHKFEKYLSDSNTSENKNSSNLYESDSSFSQKSFEKFGKREKSEVIAAISTESSHFDTVGTDCSSKSDGYVSQSSTSVPQVIQRSSKRSERRRKLRELNKS